ncbi:class I SAM-dependent DNA methyltransferase [Vibrio sonorensis]|uniref:class I SAM-dependent DNA methyltransferase n=1 Tax=Vibrio sonorensis TaxID=1004316 RepID=UPI0008DAA789|nr:methyltransferase domain-containing protein [Vibrio sonorensis]
MTIDWDALAADWDNQEATAEYAAKVFESLRQVYDVKGKHVLDFGCGTGLLSEKLAPVAKDIVALDASESMIEQLDTKQLDNVEPVVDMLTRGLVAMHPAFRGQFDLVVASSVCGFLNNFADIADIVFSILEEDGVFVHWDWLVDSDNLGSGFTESKVKRVLTSVGFSEVQVTTPFSVNTPDGEMHVVMGIGKK